MFATAPFVTPRPSGPLAMAYARNNFVWFSNWMRSVGSGCVGRGRAGAGGLAFAFLTALPFAGGDFGVSSAAGGASVLSMISLLLSVCRVTSSVQLSACQREL